MDITQEAAANKQQREAISTQIESLLEKLNELSLSQTTLAEQADRAEQEVAACSADLESLRSQQNELIETLAQETKNAAALRITHNKEAQDLNNEMERQQAAAEKEIANLTQMLEEVRAQADQYILEREEALAQKTKTSEAAQTLLDQHTASHKILLDELKQIDQQLKEALNAAAIRRSVAHIEKEGAESSVQLAQKALDDTTSALNDADQILKDRQQALEEIQTSRGQEIEETRTMCENLINEARAEEQEASKAFISKKQELSKAQTMAELSTNALATAEKNNRRMYDEMKSLYQKAEEEAAQISSDMEETLKQAVAERNNYTKAVALAEEIEKEAALATAEEAKITELVSRLSIEVHDLRNAALVARNLVTDATIAKSNSNPDMVGAMTEMERALAISAEETQMAADEKAAELAEAEKKLHSITGLSRQKQQDAEKATNLLQEAEQRCLAAEQKMFELSVQAENRGKSKTGQMIANKRSAYDQSLREAKELKLAATNAGNNLRRIKNDVTKAERAMTISARNAAQTIAACENAIAEAEQRYDAQITEARALLEIAADKREKLYATQTNKKLNLEECQNQLDLKIEAESEAISGHEALVNSAQTQLSNLKSQLEAVIAKDNAIYEQAKQVAEEAAARHEKILQDSITASDNIIAYQERLTKRKTAYEKMLEVHRTQKEAAQNLADYQDKENTATCHGLERRLANLDAPLNLAILNLDLAKKHCAHLRAGRIGLDLRQKRYTDQLDHLTQKRDELAAAEEQFAAQIREERRIEALRAAEALAKKEEEERQRETKEKIRVAQELEAAHIEAEGVRAKKAAEQARHRKKAEKEAILLASGQFLTPMDNLRLIRSGELTQRISAMSEFAKEEVNRQEVRWLTLDAAADLMNAAKQARMGATLQEGMFTAAQATYNSICNELEDRQLARKHAGQRLAGAIAAGYRAERRESALEQAITGARAALLCLYGAEKESFQQALDQLLRTKQNSEQAKEALEADYAAALADILQTDQDIAATAQAAEEARSLLNEIANKWIYTEYQAVRLEAEVEVMRCEVADRNEIADLAQQRFEAAKKAAELSAEGEERIGSVQKLATQRRKKKKKKK